MDCKKQVESPRIPPRDNSGTVALTVQVVQRVCQRLSFAAGFHVFIG